jgi:hypothetical protein
MNPCLVNDGYVIETLWRRWGLSPKKIGKEFHSGCPVCGGTKRAWVSAQGYFKCRECDFGEFLDSDKVFELDPAKVAEANRLAQERAIRREQNIAQRLQELRTHDPQVAYVQGRDDEAEFLAKEYFNSQGIDDRMIQKYHLGYTADHVVKTDTGLLHLPAYTIPIRHPVTDELVNYQYRLVDPPDGIGKYQQQYGLPSAAFYAEPMPDGISGDAIVCEGSKKAMVVYDHIEARTQVVGLPGCSPAKHILDQIKSFERVWLMLDPNCEKQEQRFKDYVPQTKVVHLPGKPDDLLLGGMSLCELREYLRLARD